MAWAKFWDIMFADFVWLGQNNCVFFFLHYFHKIKLLYFIIKKKELY